MPSESDVYTEENGIGVLKTFLELPSRTHDEPTEEEHKKLGRRRSRFFRDEDSDPDLFWQRQGENSYRRDSSSNEAWQEHEAFSFKYTTSTAEQEDVDFPTSSTFLAESQPPPASDPELSGVKLQALQEVVSIPKKPTPPEPAEDTLEEILAPKRRNESNDTLEEAASSAADSSSFLEEDSSGKRDGDPSSGEDLEKALQQVAGAAAPKPEPKEEAPDPRTKLENALEEVLAPKPPPAAARGSSFLLQEAAARGSLLEQPSSGGNIEKALQEVVYVV